MEIKERLGFGGTRFCSDNKYIIVDDLVQTGGTLLECAKMLRSSASPAATAPIIHSFATHAVFPNRSYRRFMCASTPIDQFVCTDSNPAVSDILERIPQFKVLHLHDVMDSCLQQHVFVGSTNVDKLAAVSDAYVSNGTWCRIYGIGVPSGVNEQPVGEETEIGCSKRLSALQVHSSIGGAAGAADYWALENGIIHGYDLCVVKAKVQDMEFNSRSAIVRVPEYAIEQSEDSGFTKTCGSIIEKTEGLEPGTWHEVYSGKSRRQLMYDAVNLVLVKGYLRQYYDEYSKMESTELTE